MGFLKKSQEIWKKSVFLAKIYKIPYFAKPSNGKKLIKNPLKSDKLQNFPKNLQNYLISNALNW